MSAVGVGQVKEGRSKSVARDVLCVGSYLVTVQEEMLLNIF